ncbi:MAG: suppressor of fused domain protein, partial [Cyanobacteria bacterium]|nr:suppressor of fused domain protein [Cyanobacteriota bacterium]
MSSKRRKKSRQAKGSGDDRMKSVEYMPVVYNSSGTNRETPEKSTPGGDVKEPESSPESVQNEVEAKGDEPTAPRQERKSVKEVLEDVASDREMEGRRRKLLADAWRARDLLYQQLFGKPSYVTPANYAPPSEVVPDDFEQRQASMQTDTADPGDPTLEEQHLSILAYGPDPLRPYWTYVTAGLASPWLQYEPQEASGFGCELVVKSPVDAAWAPQFLRSLAFYVFNHAGILSPGVRIGLNGPIDPHSNSEIRNAFIWYADEAPEGMYELPSGFFAILGSVGITDGERKYADSVEEYGTWCIYAVLRKTGHDQITDPTRECIMKR